VLIRDAEPADMAAVGELRVAAYRAGQHLSAGSGYEPRLRQLGADGHGDVLVAVSRAGPEEASEVRRAGRIVGTVMLQLWPDAGDVVKGPGEAEIRALAVSPDTQGSGTGTALLRAVIDRARVREVRHLVLFTQPDMLAAQHMYQRAGFNRLPERDLVRGPEFRLLAYGLILDA
jgi:ribosomal protein S18 acetylase RimI-like enzyme